MNDFKQMAQMLSSAIDSYSIELYNDGHREHLGASVLGKACSRELWYSFRWVKQTKHKANLYRLWNRGHLEEGRILQWLRGIGCKIDEYDPNSRLYQKENGEFIVGEKQQVVPMLWIDCSDDLAAINIALQRGIKRKQLRVSFCGGHAGGSCDAVGYLPPQFNYAKPVLFEFKTANTQSSSKLEQEGVVVSKREHYAQMNIYGRDLLPEPIELCCYISVNKNNDEIYIEFVPLSVDVANKYELKAFNIITANEPPPKIAQNAGSFSCRWCDFNDVCHMGAAYEKNCRSCKHSMAIDNKQWFCKLHNTVLGKDTIKLGCDSHEEAR